MISSWQRGRKIIFKNAQWVYADNLESIIHERSCKRCKRMPTPEGYDACLGYVPNAISVCCGHGEYPPIIGLKKMPIAYFQLSDLFFDWGTITAEEAIKRIRDNDIDIRSNITQQDKILFKLLNNMDVIKTSIEEGRITIQLEYR